MTPAVRLFFFGDLSRVAIPETQYFTVWYQYHASFKKLP